MEMDYKTVVGFYLNSFDHSSDEAAVRLEELEKRLVKTWNLYQWGFKVADGDFICDAARFADAISKMAKVLRTIETTEDGAWVITDLPAQYEEPPEVRVNGFTTHAIDIEEGRFNFANSFVIHDEGAKIYLNTEQFYSSEIGSGLGAVLGSSALGISCDMNDVDGDYFEFEV